IHDATAGLATASSARSEPRCGWDSSSARGRGRTGGGVMNAIRPEAQMTVPVSADRDHIQGPDGAPVTLVAYGDYELPYCGAAYPVLKEIQAQMGDGLLFVFRNFPITSSHPHAEKAAEAAEAASEQGRFWEMHDHLYEHQQQLTGEHLHAYAQVLRLDLK